MAKLCSLLRGRTPITPSRGTRSAVMAFLVPSNRPSAVCEGLVRSRISTQVFGAQLLSRGVSLPSRKKASISSPSISRSTMPLVSWSASTRWFS